MLHDIHEQVISEPVDINTSGDNTIVSANADNDSYIYIHELALTAAGAVTLQVKAGSRVLFEIDLAANQAFVLDDIPGHDGTPRFYCRPGEDFVLNLSSGVVVTGGIAYSFRH